MIREMGNVELFELCETIPKVQCSGCLLYWNQGVCGHLLVESESCKKINELRLDALSIPHYEIKNVRHHGARQGKTEAKKKYHIAWNAWKRCCKRVDSLGEHFTGIHDHFLRDHDDNEQETSEMKSEEFAWKSNVLAFASRPKAKARPRRRTPACSSTRTVPVS